MRTSQHSVNASVLEEKAAALLDLGCLGSDNDRPARRVLANELLAEMPELRVHNIFTMALCGEHRALANLLAEQPTLANTRGGPRDWTPLRYLCYGRVLGGPKCDWLESARLLVNAGADPNDTIILYEKCHYTLVTGAAGEGERGVENEPPHEQALELVKVLLDAGARANDGQALYNTHFTSDNRLLELLLAHGLKQGDLVNFSEDGTTTLDYLLFAAVDRGFAGRVSLLLKHQASPQAKSIYNHRSVYALAMRQGREDIAQMLVTAGAEAVLDPEDQLLVLIHDSNFEAARQWLAQHPELKSSVDVFVQFAEQGNGAALALMLDAGSEIDAENRNHRTALHVAAMNDHREVARLLISRGAVLERRDPSYGGTPVSWAHVHGKYELRDELLALTTDFFDLVRFGCVEKVRMLLQEMPERALHTSPTGNTVLHLIAGDTKDPEQMIDLLLRSGANINARNAQGKTPLDVQEEPEDTLSRELLRARGARSASD